MNKRIFTLVVLPTLFVLCLHAQAQQDSTIITQQTEKQVEIR